MKKDYSIPEHTQVIDKNMSINELNLCMKDNTYVVGFVENIDSDKRILDVHLGNNIFGILPFDEATIYPLKYKENQNYPVQIFSLLNKKICVKVTSVENGKILLSRKANQIDAYNYLSNLDTFTFHITNIYGRMTFGDVGCGVLGVLYINELCKSRIRDPHEILSSNSNIIVKKIDCDDERDYQFTVSYKQAFPEYDQKDFPLHTVVEGFFNEPVDDLYSGYYVYISPQVTGICDRPTGVIGFEYGKRAIFNIRGYHKQGLKLEFLEFFN